MKKIITKALCMLLAVLMCTAAFSSCDTKSDTKYNVGICQYSDHGALDSSTDGFMAVLKEKLGDDISFTVKNANGGKDEAIAICNLFVSEKYDLIFANSTKALETAANITSEIPIVAASVTDFAFTLGADAPVTKTGTNITGVSDMLPLEKQAQVVKELFPEAKKIGILYCSSETNSKYQADIIKGHFTSFGYTAEDYTFVDTTDLSAVTAKAAGECDVIYTPTDNTVASNTQAINNILEPAKIPLVAGNYDVALQCGVATVGIDYYDSGRTAGLMAYEILVNGAAPGEMEIGYSEQYNKVYVPERCNALGITVPDTYLPIED